MRSMCAWSSGVSFTSSAFRLSSSCSSVRGPMIGLVTCGCPQRPADRELAHAVALLRGEPLQRLDRLEGTFAAEQRRRSQVRTVLETPFGLRPLPPVLTRQEDSTTCHAANVLEPM